MELQKLLDAVVPGKVSTLNNSNIAHGNLVIHYVPESFDQLAEAVVDFIHNETVEETHVMFSAGYGYENRVVTCCWYQARGERSIASIQPFTALPGRMAEQGTLQTVSDSTPRDFSRSTADGLRSLYATFTIRPYPHLMKHIHQEWAEVSESLKDAEGFNFSLAFAPMSKAIISISRRATHTIGGPLPDVGPFFTVMLSPSWKLFADDDRIRLGVDRILARSWAMVSEKGRVQGSIFSNYAYHEGNVFQSSGENILAAPEDRNDTTTQMAFSNRHTPVTSDSEDQSEDRTRRHRNA